MFTLFIMMMERVGLIILLAFLLVNVSFFKKILLNRQLLSAKIKLIAIFATFAIISNFTGIVITDNQLLPGDFSTVLNADTSIANTRTLAIGVAGIIGGPFVGVGVGIIAGIHRVMQAGGTSLFYIVSSILVGCLAGYIGRNYIRLNKMPSTKKAFLLGTLMESIQMVFILFFSCVDGAVGFQSVSTRWHQVTEACKTCLYPGCGGHCMALIRVVEVSEVCLEFNFVSLFSDSTKSFES